MPQSIATGESRPTDNHVIRFKTACIEAGVSVATMRRYLSAGRGPRLVRLSERVHGFRRGDLDAWIESRIAG
ncbi:hypothetical protein MKK70_25255 [Methylobacterium sp. E-041]|uniref:helix-turn-helix transcriptional regulator n=1 Tax=Methylobacterium sp. E-041 TaxID=2836573 RepID=UPI001FB88499|nr:hypothetical protein [Methylobacterium sp. E-041]MCJ2108620.1 hypothetical protein [Methylobacterium sp. E-041]